MEETIRTMLLDYFRLMLNRKHLEDLNVDVNNVVNFLPFEMNYEDLNNITGINVPFTCWIKAKQEGAIMTKKTYSFSFTGVKAVISSNNKLIGLNFDELSIPFFNIDG